MVFLFFETFFLYGSSTDYFTMGLSLSLPFSSVLDDWLKSAKIDEVNLSEPANVRPGSQILPVVNPK